jgi:hypothetical protein
VGAAVKLAVEVTVNVGGTGVELGEVVDVGSGVFVNVGCACSVCAMAAETVSATIVAICPVSTSGAAAGADAVGSPGTTQAVIVAKNIRAMKNVRLVFMVLP